MKKLKSLMKFYMPRKKPPKPKRLTIKKLPLRRNLPINIRNPSPKQLKLLMTLLLPPRLNL